MPTNDRRRHLGPYLRAPRSIATEYGFARHEVDQSELLLGDIALLEVLRGARDEAHARKLEMQLRRFMIASMLGEQTALAAAANYRLLRTAGVTMSKLADLIIGTFCIENGHRLLADDRDFSHMATHLGLRLARPRHLDPG